MKDQQLLDTSFGQKNKGLNSQLCGRKRFLSARSIGRRLFGGIYPENRGIYTQSDSSKKSSR
ncbi:hypothetical protein, partial [Sutterella wadsworthensis]